jgi:hypothetical protein
MGELFVVTGAHVVGNLAWSLPLGIIYCQHH